MNVPYYKVFSVIIGIGAKYYSIHNKIDLNIMNARTIIMIKRMEVKS